MDPNKSGKRGFLSNLGRKVSLKKSSDATNGPDSGTQEGKKGVASVAKGLLNRARSASVRHSRRDPGNGTAKQSEALSDANARSRSSSQADSSTVGTCLSNAVQSSVPTSPSRPDKTKNNKTTSVSNRPVSWAGDGGLSSTTPQPSPSAGLSSSGRARAGTVPSKQDQQLTNEQESKPPRSPKPKRPPPPKKEAVEDGTERIPERENDLPSLPTGAQVQDPRAGAEVQGSNSDKTDSSLSKISDLTEDDFDDPSDLIPVRLSAATVESTPEVSNVTSVEDDTDARTEKLTETPSNDIDEAENFQKASEESKEPSSLDSEESISRPNDTVVSTHIAPAEQKELLSDRKNTSQDVVTCEIDDGEVTDEKATESTADDIQVDISDTLSPELTVDKTVGADEGLTRKSDEALSTNSASALYNSNFSEQEAFEDSGGDLENTVDNKAETSTAIEVEVGVPQQDKSATDSDGGAKSSTEQGKVSQSDSKGRPRSNTETVGKAQNYDILRPRSKTGVAETVKLKTPTMVSMKNKFRIGQRVKVEGYDGYGVIRYVGNHQSKTSVGGRIGVELDHPGIGKNSGTIDGVVYFKCLPYTGVLVKPKKVKVVDESTVITPAAARAALRSREWIPRHLLLEFERICLYSVDVINQANQETFIKLGGCVAITLVLFGIAFVITGMVYVVLVILGILLGAAIVGVPKFEEIARVQLPRPNPGINTDIIKNVKQGPSLEKLDNRLTGSQIIDDEINRFVDLLLRDYVDTWFSAMTTHTACPIEMRRTIQSTVIAFSNHCKRVDWTSLLTNSFVEDFKSHVRLYRAAQIEADRVSEDGNEKKKEKRNRERFNINTGPAEREQLLEQFFFNKEQKFAKVCSDKAAEAMYCRNIADVLCYLLLPEDAFNDRTIRLLLREMLTTNLLMYSANVFSDPDYVNQTIAMGIGNTTLTFQAIQAAAHFCTVEELQAIRENIDMDIDARLKGVNNTSGSIADNAQKNKHEIDELLALKRHCEKRIQLFTTGANDEGDNSNAEAVDGQLIDIRLSDVLEDESGSVQFTQFLENKGSLPILAVYNCIEWYRQCEVKPAKFASGNHVLVNNTECGIVKFVGCSARTGKLCIGIKLKEDNEESVKLREDAAPHFGCKKGEIISVDIDDVSIDPDAEDPTTPVPSGSQDLSFEVDSERRNIAKDIYERFLATEDGKKMGMPPEMVNKIGVILSDSRYRVHLSLFDDVHLHLYHHLESVCLREFKTREEYVPLISEIQDKLKADLQDSIASRNESGASNRRDSISSMLDIADFAPESFEVGGVWRASLTEAREVNDGKKNYTVYVIKVVYTSPGGDRKEWKTQRRYSEFDNFHKTLQNEFEAEVADCELSLPNKKLFGNMSKDFIKKRGEKLIEWLAVLTSSDFLKRDPRLISTISKFLMQGAFEKSSKKKRDRQGRKSGKSHDNEFDVDDQGRAINIDDDEDDDREDLMPVRIMLSLFDDIFELRGNRWTRRAVKTVLGRILRGFFGDKVNHMINDTINHSLEPDQVAATVKRQRDEVWWPEDTLAPDPQPREKASQIRTQIEARAKIFGLLPDEVKKLVGTKTARTGVNNLFEMFQNRRLTKRLVFAMLETTLLKVFPGHFEKVFAQTHKHVAKAKDDNKNGLPESQP